MTLPESNAQSMRSNYSLVKILGAIGGGLLFFLLVVLFCIASRREDVLANAVNGYVEHILPTLSPIFDSPTGVAVGKNAVWWIGDGVQYAGGGTTRSNGTMRSSWGGGALSLAPRFEELDSILIVKGALGEEKQYLRVPAGMQPAPDLMFNPFKSKDASPSSFIDRYGKTHSADEFKLTLRTYGLQVWIVDVKSSRVVGYREFPAAPLLKEYDQNHTADEVDLRALVGWSESLVTLGRTPTA